MNEESGGKTKLYLIGGSVIALLVLVGIIVLLYSLGGADQSALERLRDIAVIFVVLLGIIAVVLLAGVTAALTYLVFQVKDRVLPMLEEVLATLKRARGTVDFVSEEAVRPIVSAAGTIARVKAMANAAAGRDEKRK